LDCFLKIKIGVVIEGAAIANNKHKHKFDPPDVVPFISVIEVRQNVLDELGGEVARDLLVKTYSWRDVREKVKWKLVQELLVLIFIVVDVDFYFFNLKLFSVTAGLVDLLAMQLVDVVFRLRVAYVVECRFKNECPFLVEGGLF